MLCLVGVVISLWGLIYKGGFFSYYLFYFIIILPAYKWWMAVWSAVLLSMAHLLYFPLTTVVFNKNLSVVCT